MTGVGAQLCVSPPSDLKSEIEEEAKKSSVARMGCSPLHPQRLVPSRLIYCLQLQLANRLVLREGSRPVLPGDRSGTGLAVRDERKPRFRVGSITRFGQRSSFAQTAARTSFMLPKPIWQRRKLREQFPCPHCGVTVSGSFKRKRNSSSTVTRIQLSPQRPHPGVDQLLGWQAEARKETRRRGLGAP